jgi:hypothetical protein
MANWKSILKLSDKEEHQREAAFEAAMMAELTKVKPSPAPAQPPVVARPSVPVAPPKTDAVAITVTQAGKTTTYTDLATVPVALRQRIMNAWLASPPPSEP